MRERKRACASLPTLDQNSGESGKAVKLVDNKWVWRKKGNSKPGETVQKIHVKKTMIDEFDMTTGEK